MVKISENQIQIDVVNWCRKNDVLVYHIENELPMAQLIRKALGEKFWALIKHRNVMGLHPGVCDLHFPEFLLYFELKTKTGKLSEAQKEFIERVRKTHTVIVPRSTFEAVSYIKKRKLAMASVQRDIKLIIDKINKI